MNDTPTPETDAFSNNKFHDRAHELTELYNFTMGLERKLNAAKAESEAMREVIKEVYHSFADEPASDASWLLDDRQTHVISNLQIYTE
jgi:hypothetical protein